MIRHRIAPSLARGTRIEDAATDYRRNGGTALHCEAGAFSREALTGWLALARYESALRRALDTEPPDRVFVAAVDSDGQPASTAVLAPGDAIVFGRHTRAELRNDAPDLSLRHVAVAVAPDSTAGAPLVRAWDLATGRPFAVEGGHVCEAITVNGPVFATVGSVHLAVIPLSRVPSPAPVGTRALWQSLPRREHVVARVAEGSVSRAPVAPVTVARAAGACSRRATRVTQLPAAVPLDRDHDDDGVNDIDEAFDGPAVARVELVTDELRCRYRVSVNHLDRGVLIGRYGRCAGPDELPDDVSRVHLLIARVGGHVMAIDTASTCGVFAGRSARPFVTMTLERDCVIRLARSVLVRWRARAVADA